MKYIKTLVLYSLLFCVGISSVNAQTFKAEDALVQNKKVKKGALANGMTYYIYPTAVNKGTASYYIIQNVGSILENDKQKGLAHFLEHMAFNGTKSFPGKGVMTTLEKQGAIFGQNINAYTSYDETVYNFDNIPATDPKVVDDCLLILHDWSHSLLLTNEEIDSERGVITEEWRTRQNAGARIFNQFSPFLFNHSLYTDRDVIGDMNIVKHFEYQVLRDFYKDWYRPDLQAIAVVGDVNVAQIEQKIKNLFADIPVIQNPLKRFEVVIPDHNEPLFKLATDKEITRSNISFVVTQKRVIQGNTFAYLQQAMVQNIAFSILNDRLNALSQKEDCAFIGASASYSNFTRTNDALSIEIAPKPNKQAVALATVMDEFVRASKFGFSDGEIQRAIASTVSFYENYIESENEVPHQSIIKAVKDDYLSHQVFTEPKAEFEMVKAIFKNLDSKTLQAELVREYTSKNRVIAVTGLENETNLTQEEAFSIIAKSENNPDLKPYEDTFSGKSLLTDVTIVPGKIVSEKPTKEIDATTFTLSNGVKVHYKFANKNVSDVQLRAESFGGASLYQPKDLPSLYLLSWLTQSSGLGTLSSTDLEKILTGKNAESSVNIEDLTETVSGNAKTKDLETMMQLVHLRFAKPRFDAEMFNIIKSNLENKLKNKDKDINTKMSDSLNAAIYGKNNPRIRVLNQEFINDLSFERMKAIYQERFCDV
jgi:zinc protease